MASKQIFIAYIAVLAVIPTIVMAKEFKVGDDSGWTIGFDYQAWANGKEFHVGDKLVFKYPLGAHNVHKVNATGFQECIVPTETEALASGNDVITLASPGRKWYICGVGKHCAVGSQKLVITVLPEWNAPAPSPVASKSPPNGIVTPGLQVMIAILILIVMIITG